MICKADIANLKTDIVDKLGQKIIVKGSLGRSRVFEKEATIEKAYPNIFVVKYEENNRNVTYSYTDVLTRTVEVDVFDGNQYSPLIPPLEPKKKAVRGDAVN
ncbi:MAG: Veg family protein [Clostridia bacterium]|nr:Veg family protein [Clostridia bacterium]